MYLYSIVHYKSKTESQNLLESDLAKPLSQLNLRFRNTDLC